MLYGTAVEWKAFPVSAGILQPSLRFNVSKFLKLLHGLAVASG